MSFSKLDDAIIEMQKKLYREECIKEARIKRGGKFYPFNIEPMPTERERLIKKMTDEERALRKQWLEDQKLSPREPVSVPEFTRKNIFRRAYAGFFDGIAGVFRPVLVCRIILLIYSLIGTKIHRILAQRTSHILDSLSRPLYALV